jgi:5-methylcytosine-specific restriction protein B
LTESQESFAPVIRKFLEQAVTDDLSYASYPKEYMGLSVKVSFGQGNQAKIPWISLLGEGHTTSRGIYPVYLYFKSAGKLVLAYGVSETNPPSFYWDVDEPSIEKYFLEKGLLKPERYHHSQIFRCYDVGDALNGEKIDQDLKEIITEYFTRMGKETRPSSGSSPFSVGPLKSSLIAAGLSYSDNLLHRFCTSLITKPFVILTGLSGSGKTRLATSLAKWMCADESQFCTVAVGADWTNRDPLIGYPNALEQGKYVLPESGALSLLLEAAKPANRDLPFFLILDEMNLSHVERYFADFLSSMESGAPIRLHSGNSLWSEIVPPSVIIPDNLFIIGTVNVDETTYMFSPKVLDRANVIEFKVSDQEMGEFLRGSPQPASEKIDGSGAGMATSFLNLARGPADTSFSNELTDTLLLFFRELQPLGAEFGYRSAEMMVRFLAIAREINPAWSMNDILDAVIVQKLLPKVHGSRRRLEPILGQMGLLCASGTERKDVLLGDEDPPASIVKFPLTLSKVRRMYRNVCANGFASFAEA